MSETTFEDMRRYQYTLVYVAVVTTLELALSLWLLLHDHLGGLGG